MQNLAKEATFSKLITPLSQIAGQFLVLEYGWEINNTVDNSLFPKKLKEYFQTYETKKMILQYTGKHELDFQEDGKINLTVVYNALNDSAMYSDISLSVPDRKEVIGLIYNKDDTVLEIHKKYLAVKKEREDILNKIQDLQQVNSSDVIKNKSEREKE
jgi:hypothetical protein